MFKILLSHHGHNVLGDGLGVNLESCVSVTNLAEFKICLVHEVLGIGDFTIFNIINLVSDSLCPGLKLTDVGVGGDDVLYWFTGERTCVLVVERTKRWLNWALILGI